MISQRAIRREAREEARADRAFFAGLTRQEASQLRRQVDCGSGGHLPLAGQWRRLTPESDGRLHARCLCGADVNRVAFRS